MRPLSHGVSPYLLCLAALRNVGYNSWNLLALGIEYGGSWSKSNKERSTGKPMQEETRANLANESQDGSSCRTFYHSVHQLCVMNKEEGLSERQEEDVDQESCGLVDFHEKHKVYVTDREDG